MHKLEPVDITANAQDFKENTFMNTPKLLPWCARKAGVSIDRADDLWREAIRDATEGVGRVGRTEYSGEALPGFTMHRFIELLDHERSAAQYPSDVYSLVNNPSRLWELPLAVVEGVFNSTSAHWRRQIIDWRRQINPTLHRAAYSTTIA